MACAGIDYFAVRRDALGCFLAFWRCSVSAIMRSISSSVWMWQLRPCFISSMRRSSSSLVRAGGFAPCTGNGISFLLRVCWMKMVIAPDIVRPMLLKRLSARRLVSSSILKFTCAMVLCFLCVYGGNYTKHLIATSMGCYTNLISREGLCDV